MGKSGHIVAGSVYYRARGVRSCRRAVDVSRIRVELGSQALNTAVSASCDEG